MPISFSAWLSQIAHELVLLDLQGNAQFDVISSDHCEGANSSTRYLRKQQIHTALPIIGIPWNMSSSEKLVHPELGCAVKIAAKYRCARRILLKMRLVEQIVF